MQRPTASRRPAAIRPIALLLFLLGVGSEVAASESASADVEEGDSDLDDFYGWGYDDDDYLEGSCLVDKTELKTAVVDYITQNCTHDPDCDVTQTYGYPINSWCVSNVTDMSELFAWASDFDDDISGWDVSRVTDMNSMFAYASSFNGSIGEWDVSGVGDFGFMFENAWAFNQDLSDWAISNEASTEYMFWGASSFNQNLCAWADTFPYQSVKWWKRSYIGTFLHSGCTYTKEPKEGNRGPFCASSCPSAPSPAPSTESPTSAGTTETPTYDG